MTLADSPTHSLPDTRSGPEAASDGAWIARPAVLAPAGVLLAVGASVSYFYMLLLPGVRTTAWPTFAMLTLAVALGGAAVVRRRRWWTVLLAVTNVLTAGSFISFFSLGLSLPEPQSGPEVADAAPDFRLLDHQGRMISLSSTLGKGPVLLVFHRGVACVFCRARLGVHTEMQKQLEKIGGTVLAVSADTPESCAREIESCKLNYPVLADPDMKVIDRYGLRHDNATGLGDVALPATLLIDRDGVIRWKHVPRDVKDAPQPATIEHEIGKLTGR